jgi:hypothetical protein
MAHIIPEFPKDALCDLTATSEKPLNISAFKWGILRCKQAKTPLQYGSTHFLRR